MADVVMYSKSWCPYCDRAKALLTAKGQEWTEFNIEADLAKRDEMLARSNGQRTVPQIFIDGQHVGGFDEMQALEDRDELDAMLGREKAAPGAAEHRRVIIIGSGPAGYTAAIYAARAELAPLVLAGLQFGGQLMLTTDVENYPGFPEGVTGPEMMDLFQKQAERFGADVLMEDATELDMSERPFKVKTAAKTYTADALIIATGASAKWLGIDSEQRLMNRGVSACATCDGALFRGLPMAVVGGGDTALEEALFLTRFASKVTLIHRRDELRASRIMQERARSNDKIEFAWNSAVDEILGDEAVTGVRLKDVNTGATREVPVEAVFIAIGHKPNTELLEGQITLDDVGYVKVEPGTSRTNIEGVFACGDAADPVYRQAVTAAGTGCMAAIDSERWLAEQGIE
jgi:thioredoxin reductase (NADPH)